jgi:hypothetical protein
MTHVHNTSGSRKTADNLFKLMLEEKTFIEEKIGLRLIGWVSDASGESRAARKMLKQRFPQLITVDCYAHQVRPYHVNESNLTTIVYDRCN